MNSIIHLQVADEKMTALITQIPHRSHSMYRIIFESGYENIFFTDVETGKWIEEDLGFSALAEKVGEQIRNLTQNFFHVPKILTWHKQFVAGKLVCFGFFNFMKGPHRMYEIYNANKKYMYTLVDMNNEEWQILGTSNEMLNKVEPHLIKQIVQVLPFYYANV
ncbi:MAG: hypothetical protein ABIT07_04910 [Ferruginibacter sp.]